MTAARTVVLALVVALAAAAAARAGDGQTLLVIGDSLAQGTAYDWYRDGRSLKRRLATAGWRVREKYGNGLQLDEGADLVARWPARLPPVLVVQLGTNSDPRLPAVFRKQVLRIVDAAGPGRCVVWVNMFGPLGYAPLNRVLDRIAVARPGFRVIDWAAAASTHPEWLVEDVMMGVHPLPAGYYWRQRAILREANACERWLASSTTAASPARAASAFRRARSVRLDCCAAIAPVARKPRRGGAPRARPRLAVPLRAPRRRRRSSRAT